jgi:hypothetical protein
MRNKKKDERLAHLMDVYSPLRDKNINLDIWIEPQNHRSSPTRFPLFCISKVVAWRVWMTFNVLVMSASNENS